MLRLTVAWPRSLTCLLLLLQWSAGPLPARHADALSLALHGAPLCSAAAGHPTAPDDRSPAPDTCCWTCIGPVLPLHPAMIAVAVPLIWGEAADPPTPAGLPSGPALASPLQPRAPPPA